VTDPAPRPLAHRVARRIAAVLAGWAVYALLLALLPVRAAAADAPAAPQGRAAWDRAGCAVCHSLYGLGGHLGPDLTDAHGRLGPAALRAIVRRGGSVMPAFALDDAELDALLAFLAEADAGGSFAPRSLGDPPFGS
jgi:mono/diheme cytochrome c family protein